VNWGKKMCPETGFALQHQNSDKTFFARKRKLGFKIQIS
jgi:hypothetical protein